MPMLRHSVSVNKCFFGIILDKITGTMTCLLSEASK